MSIVMRAAKGDGEVLIYDGIGADFWGDGVTAKGFAKELSDLGAVNSLTIRINSGGGDVWDGIAIHEAIARHPAAKKTVVVDGLAASIASVIAMAGDEIRIAPGGFFMVHNAWSMSVGDAATMRKTAELLDSVSGQMANIYAARTGKPAAKIKEWMNAETWFDAETAVSNGFADAKSQDVVKVAASLDYSRFRNVPRQLRGAVPTPRLDALAAKIAAKRRT
jgi:ATP-dependent Clp protease protease subunit